MYFILIEINLLRVHVYVYMFKNALCIAKTYCVSIFIHFYIKFSFLTTYSNIDVPHLFYMVGLPFCYFIFWKNK